MPGTNRTECTKSRNRMKCFLAAKHHASPAQRLMHAELYHYPLYHENIYLSFIPPKPYHDVGAIAVKTLEREAWGAV